MKMKSESEVAQLCPTLSDPMDCSSPGSSIHEIFQARVLEWGAKLRKLYLLCSLGAVSSLAASLGVGIKGHVSFRFLAQAQVTVGSSLRLESRHAPAAS